MREGGNNDNTSRRLNKKSEALAGEKGGNKLFGHVVGNLGKKEA